MQELRLLSKTPLAGRSLQQTNTMMELLKLRDAASSSSSKRKRMKRRKKKLPRCVSSRGRARRRQRQCLLSGCSVFPSIDDWSQMLDIIASMDQKDSIPRLWCARRRLRQWHVQAGFTGYVAFALYSHRLSAGPCCRASWSSWTGLFAARCATTRLMVQTVQIYVLVQFLDKVVIRPLRPKSLNRCISWTRLLSSRQVPWSRQ